MPLVADAGLLAQPRRGRRRPASARRRGRRTRVAGRAPPRRPPRPRCPGVATTTYGATLRVEAADVGRGDGPARRPGRRRVGDRVDDASPASRRPRRASTSAPAMGVVPTTHRTAARADAVPRRSPGCPPEWQVMTSSMTPSPRRPSAGRVLRQPEQPRLAVGERAERLADDDRLGAAAADPALDRAVRMDDAARAGPRRGRPPDGHDRGDRERPAGRLELGGAREDGPARSSSAPVSVDAPSRAGSPRPSGA